MQGSNRTCLLNAKCCCCDSFVYLEFWRKFVRKSIINFRQFIYANCEILNCSQGSCREIAIEVISNVFVMICIIVSKMHCPFLNEMLICQIRIISLVRIPVDSFVYLSNFDFFSCRSNWIPFASSSFANFE